MVEIKSLPRDPGPAAWNAILPDRPVGPALEGSTTADWVIIGAGFAGLAAARRLRQLHAEDRIVVLEARAIAEGPVGRNSGFMIDLPHVLSSKSYGGETEADRGQIDANRAAIAFGREAVEDYGIESEAFDQMGKVNGAMEPGALALNDQYAQHLTALGEASETLDAKDMQELTGSQAYVGGLFTAGTVVLQPAMFARGMAQGLLRDGVEIFENSPCIKLIRRDGNWVISTPRGAVETPKAILAVNGQIERFGHFKRRVMHVYLYASMTRALSGDEVRTLGGAPKWGITPSDPMGSTVRRISGTGGDRIVLRNCITYDPDLSGSDRKLGEFARKHARGISRRFPTLAGVELEHCWGGALCLSRTNTPAFGEVDEDLFAATCQNGLGSAQGTLNGMLAADLASGQTSALLDRQLSLPVPTRLPPFSDLAAPQVLKWRSYRARHEL